MVSDPIKTWLVVIVLAVASVFCIRFGVSDEILRDVDSRLSEVNQRAAATGAPPDPATMNAIRLAAERARTLAPSSLYASSVIARTEPNVETAYEITSEALARHPHSTHLWATLLRFADRLNAERRLPGGQDRLHHIMRHTASVGAGDAHALLAVVDVGLANWPNLNVDVQKVVLRAAENLARDSPQAVREAAEARGRMDIICGSAVAKRVAACQKTSPLKRSS